MECSLAQVRLEAHRQQQRQQELEVSTKAELCSRAREGLRRKVGTRKDPFQVLLALKIPLGQGQDAGLPFTTQVRDVCVCYLQRSCLLLRSWCAAHASWPRQAICRA